MKTHTRLATGSILAALLLAACGAPAPESPTATVAPATAAPAATTQPTVADTAGENASSTPLGAAMEKFASTGAYRTEMEMKGKGAIGISTDENNPNSEETSLFILKGDFKGTDGHYTLKGFLSSLMGVEPDAGVEAMMAGGKIYVKGPVSMLGATEDKWYVLEGEQSEAITPPFQTADFLSALSNSDVQLGNFKSAGSETLDGKKCDILSGDKTEAAKSLAALSAGSISGVEDLADIENATAKFSLCDDGYIHRILLTMDTASKDASTLKASFSVSIHIYDFNAAITITPPANAAPLNTSDIIPDVTPSK